ncbi:MAG: tRNA uridine-5-carboxymethylaminomethyl(34) synthesis GTPase MnmE [Ferrovum myxofaciens]|uniref:tRNA uridine-5-carboxymethylaminomethyl(34) synthesis GTPase MnmE n=1 Tax=Ferrovum myxofaciens TaxID=416213 RepID=UPI002355A954|nr:tRNA uridine-5-carboxymethylaminomethyl(34) synthesis GTPase MnmE [Ferrovum myxofaciens]QKE41313.1 MAG: tRNA uridine-5-carboxymethylaminomethyl(34) synthesis GTPase MnmE [Ferrovum myxofaciens]
MESSPDIIVAQATAPIPSGVGVLRISGRSMEELVRSLTGKGYPAARQASLRSFYNRLGEVIDHGLILYFPAPHSYTGEDVVELHAHGSPVVLQELQVHCLQWGARLANPGEFTLRAYLNNKIDLNQAEAVADLIHADSSQAARSAALALSGRFSEVIHTLVSDLTTLRVRLESDFDFTDEEIPVFHEVSFRSSLNHILERLTRLVENSRQGALLREGKNIVLIGSPNVGKSSLLNALTEEDHALVTPIPGTTRDLIRGHMVLQGIPIHLVDTAGIRKTEDFVERAGIERTWSAVNKSDLALIVVDVRKGVTEDDRSLIGRLLPHQPKLIVANKIDLLSSEHDVVSELIHSIAGLLPVIPVSAQTGEGLEVLKIKMLSVMDINHNSDAPLLLARERHIATLVQALGHLREALMTFESEFIAEELRQAQLKLAQISGKEFAADDLLGEIFSRFCIGK